MSFRGLLAFCVFAILGAAGIASGVAPAASAQDGPQDRVIPFGGAPIELEPVVTTGLSNPILVTNARDGSNRLFIVEQGGGSGVGGRILVLQPGATTPTEFLNIRSKIIAGGEQGLLGLAFHPFYKNNRRFFVNYTRAGDGATVIAEYQASASNPNVADTAEAIILVIPQPFNNHNGGMIEFGPDGYLYIGMGDGGSGNDPGNRAQNINELLGKMLRIDVDHPASATVLYTSPPDNPFFGSTPGRDEIYAVGLRNPWRWSFDRGGTRQLFAGDVGQGPTDAREEADIITLGGNYGWRVFEGTKCTNLDPPLCSQPGFTPPIFEYTHFSSRCSITGGYVYRGPRASLPTGAYIYGDYCTGEIFQFLSGLQTPLLNTPSNISSFGEDEAGEVYVVGHGGSVHRIANPDAPCSFTILPSDRSHAAGSGAGSIQVVAPTACAWMAASNSGFITITGGGSGAGYGVVSYSVAANTTTAPREGTLTVAGQTFTVVQGAAFADVTAQNPFFSEIGKLSARRVTLGCGGGNYCPDSFVTREQMAAFLMRALGEFNPPPPAMQRFLDVPPSNPFYAFIDRLAALGITLGCGGGNYCPGQAVTREQMAAFLMRALGEFNPPPPAMQRFADVPPTNPFYRFIDRMAVRGITLGCGGGNYCPANPVTRQEMAAFLVRAFDL